MKSVILKTWLLQRKPLFSHKKNQQLLQIVYRSVKYFNIKNKKQHEWNTIVKMNTVT
jgi:hypothetical protein